jgi:hypothetical protein
MTAVVTILVGAIGLIIGWFVSGYQKITEKLTEERRRAYLVLICEADKANDNQKADRTALERAASDAEFICSNQMMKSGRIEELVRAVATERWMDERERFFKLGPGHPDRARLVDRGFQRGCLHRTTRPAPQNRRRPGIRPTLPARAARGRPGLERNPAAITGVEGFECTEREVSGAPVERVRADRLTRSSQGDWDS